MACCVLIFRYSGAQVAFKANTPEAFNKSQLLLGIVKYHSFLINGALMQMPF